MAPSTASGEVCTTRGNLLGGRAGSKGGLTARRKSTLRQERYCTVAMPCHVPSCEASRRPTNFVPTPGTHTIPYVTQACLAYCWRPLLPTY